MASSDSLCSRVSVLSRGDKIKSIELRSEEGMPDELHIEFNWLACRRDKDQWVKAEKSRGGGCVPLEYYYVELHEPFFREYGPDCFTIAVPDCEQVVTFYAKGQINWIDPQTLPWLQVAS